MTETTNIQSFRYDSTNFHHTISYDDKNLSEFDNILREKWEYAENNGILRYKLNIKDWKIFEGTYRFLAELNPDRAFNRRTPEDIFSMSQPFDESKFNFTKLPTKEIFLDVGDGSGNDVIAANVSPLGRGHFLFLSERLKCFPQIIRKTSLEKVLELMLLSNSPYFRVIFNSLCAHASVNHLHWHFYYLEHQMLLEDIGLEELQWPVFIFKDYPAKGFCLKQSCFPNSNIKQLVSWSYFLVNYLQENNIGHNVYITRARTDANVQIYDDIRIYIWARRSSSGVKDTRAFIPAVCELFGHLSIRSEEDYRNLSEEKVASLLKDVTENTFNQILEGLTLAIVNKMQEEINIK